MKITTALFALILFCSIATHAQTADNQPGHSEDFKISLPYHPGQLRWSAEGFKIIETSAKPKGMEIGLRGQNNATGAGFLGFLFLVPGQAPLSSAKCRDGALAEQKQNPTLKILPDSTGRCFGENSGGAGDVLRTRPRQNALLQSARLRRHQRHLR